MYLLPLAAVLAALLIPVPGGDRGAVEAQRSGVVRTRRGGPRLRVVARVPTGIQPKSVAVSPDGRRVWVANFGRPDRDNVRVYDADSLEPVGTVEFQGNAVEIAFSPNGQTAYVSNFRRHVLEVIDTRTLRVEREVQIGGHPKTIAVTPDGERLYVASWADQTVSEVDARSFELVRRLRTGNHPRGMALTRDGQRLFVAAMYSHLVHVFERGEPRQAAEFRPCNYPRHMVLSPSGDRLYASCSCCRQVRWFDPETHRLLGIGQTGENPRTIDISRDGRWIAAADFDDHTVALIDTQQLTHTIYRVPDANQIVGVAIRPRGALRLYATSWMTAELYALEPVE